MTSVNVEMVKCACQDCVCVVSLSKADRRAQSVATVLTQAFQVPPENLTTQGYGEQYLKVNTQGASRENRRVTVRRITPMLQQGGAR